ncbi:TIGR03545 family protein [Thalassotalea ponticola]|uniref:TIGR03545 family protein n=1 Tax=Thalassotalea ponticola TaxID=1523392 RepID=UPI0025B293EB|nr:TIGR03545 family protein [Thalassotalea ponticola]MDN3651875.1 TIGR03545 family protein [Thalassotalea ponticola]
MSRYFRWQGLLGFIAVVALLLLILFVAAPSLVKLSIEKTGAWYFGAEVNVADVDISYHPLTVSISDLAITDNTQPQRNVVVAKQVSATVDWWQYLFGRIIVDELVARSVAFNTERAKPGKVYRDADIGVVESSKEYVRQQLPAIDLQLPNIQQLLNNSDLQTVKASRQLEQVYQQQQQMLTLIPQQLPDKQTLASYQQDIKQLVDSDVKSVSDAQRIQQQLEQLKSQIKRDKSAISSAKQQVKDAKRELSEALVQVKNAPANDWQQLKSTYQLDVIDSADFVHILFGEQARSYYQTAVDLYQKAAPLIASENTQQSVVPTSVGRYVHFSEDTPLPNWLVKKANLEVVLLQGSFDINITELTSQHWLRNQPTQLTVDATQLLGEGSANLKASLFNGTNKVDFFGDYQFAKLPINELILRQQDAFSLSLQDALMQGQGDFSINQTGINSSSELTLTEVSYAGSATNKIGQTLLNTLQQVNRFSTEVTLTGELDAPTMRVTSDLDNVIAKSVNNQLQTELTAFQARLQQGLQDKTAGALSLSNEQAASLAQLDTLLADTDTALTQLLETKVTDSQKQKLEDKLKKKLGKLFD